MSSIKELQAMPAHQPNPPNPEPSEPMTQEPLAVGTSPRYRAEELFLGARQLVIVHGGREYSLRLTATNKLILTA